MARRQDVTFPGPGGRPQRGALALPDGEATHGALPGLLVLHEILGLNDDVRRIAARFADAGYAALVPDLFDGEGPGAWCVLRAIRSLRREGGATFELLSCARRWLADREEVDAARVGAVGFCMGGGFAVLFAAQASLQVVGTCYGDVPSRADSLRGVPPVVAGFGARDLVFGPGAQRLRRHLEALDVRHDVQVYEDAGHSYMSRHEGVTGRLGRLSPMRAAYDEGAAEDTWRRMLAFFAEHLAVARPGEP